MEKRVLLVDFENIQDFDLSKIDGSFRIVVFAGKNQNKISMQTVIKNQKLGSRLEWKQIEGTGKNALDFYMAYYLGKIFQHDPAMEVVILSKDKGFNSLISEIGKDGKKCRRIDKLDNLKP